MSLLAKRFAIIDVETTGFDVDVHEIIELGCLVAQAEDDGSFRVLQELEIKIKPERIEDADPGALRVNGYDEAQWMFAHTLTEAMTELSKVAKDAVMVAHNLSFDWQFINKAYQKTGVENTMHYQKLDTLSMAFAKLVHDPEVKNWSLRALCEYFGVVNKNAHTALADVRATFEVFVKLLRMK